MRRGTLVSYAPALLPFSGGLLPLLSLPFYSRLFPQLSGWSQTQSLAFPPFGILMKSNMFHGIDTKLLTDSELEKLVR